MVVILEEDLYHIGLSLRVTGGPTCRSLLKITIGSVINAKDMSQIFINPRGT